MPKLIRITTVPIALQKLLVGQMQFIQQQGYEVLMISADGPEREAVMEQENCRHIVVTLTRKITPFQDFICLIKLCRILHKQKPDIVHTHTPKAGLIGMLASKIVGVKLRIHTVAGLPLMVEKGLKRKLLLYIEKLTYWAATNVWPNSNSLLRFIQQNKFVADAKLNIIGKGSSNGINLTKFNNNNLPETEIENIRAKYKISETDFVFGFVGRVVFDKGIVELVKSFKKISKLYPSSKLMMVGTMEKDLDPLPMEIEKELERNKNIIQTGWTNTPEMYIAMFSCFVFPSHREGFPNVLLQAGALKIPIICSNIVGNIDIVDDGINGKYFNVTNEEALFDAMEFAINNPQEMKKFASSLYEKVHQNFEQKAYWKILLEKYNELLNNNSSKNV
jgi:glycosyltransferase involved in cell wall biosynthesis